MPNPMAGCDTYDLLGGMKPTLDIVDRGLHWQRLASAEGNYECAEVLANLSSEVVRLRDKAQKLEMYLYG